MASSSPSAPSSRGPVIAVLLSLAGILCAGYLIFMHLGLMRGELVGGLGCGGTGFVNCHAVTSSAWGSFAGVPLPIWGLFGYFLTLNLASIAWLFPESRASTLALLTGLSALFVLADAWLLYVMAAKIRHLCTVCLATYAVNVLLLLTAKRALGSGIGAALGRVPAALGQFLPSGRRPFAIMFWVVMLMVVTGTFGLHMAATYVSQGSPGAVRAHLEEFVAKQQRLRPATEGDPTMGSPSAWVELVEFSDFFCPSCQRASKLNAIIVAGHRDDVRFVFKNYPLDSTCNDAVPRMVHPGACTVAAAAECAHLQGKFWPFHDKVFEEGQDYNLAHLEQDAAGVGLEMAAFRQCMASGEGLAAVTRDIEEGRRIGVGSTPTYAINGLKMPGLMSPLMFDQLLSLLRDTDR